MLGELYYKTDFLSKDECEFLKNYYKENSDKAVRSMVGFAPARVDFTHRISKSLQLDIDNQQVKNVIDKTTEVAKHINEELFLFSIDWDESIKPKNFLITEYEGTEKGFWTKHQNVNWISNANQRKLCATIVLSDPSEYEGGDFMMYFGSSKEQPTPTEMRKQGTLVVFPAFRFTQIMPVLTGIKYHMDFYWEGPYWR